MRSNRHTYDRRRDRYDYRRRIYRQDNAFRVLPYSRYYGYSTPQVVVPHRYYYYQPRGGVTITWSW